MRALLNLLAIAVLIIAVVVWTRTTRATPPEPVRFASFQPELFSAPGALTDAWADIDGDGDPDRFVGFNGSAARLYRNDGTDGFVDVAEALGLAVERRVRTAAWGDYDADGDPDLLLGFAGEAPVTSLFRNDGASGFVDVAGEVGLALAEGTTRQASWIDFDTDGDLDLFLALRDRANRMFRNDGPDGFTDVTDATGLGDARHTVGAVWIDADQDGDLDLIVANMDGDANGLWSNEGGVFTDVAGGTALEAAGRGLGDEALGSVRPCLVDVDLDGYFDVFFSNYGPNELVRLSAGPPESAGNSLGLAIDARYDSCGWGDFDHDGAVDLFVNGTVTGGVQYRDWLMRREGGPEFVDATPPEILSLATDHGASWVDFDGDGDLDLALTGVTDEGSHPILENLLRPEFVFHSLEIRVLDENGHATRAGAEVRVYSAGTHRLLGAALVDTGSGYDAQSDLPLHFGLPGAQLVDVEVTVVGGGERRSGMLLDVDPRQHRGTVLTLRVGFDGTVAIGGGDTPR
jgi:FG-GAP-like repeat/ASPIC and UnbV